MTIDLATRLARLVIPLIVANGCWLQAQAGSALDNKYGLILESELDTRSQKDVDAYWNRTFKPGTLTGVDGIPIAYAVLRVPNEKAAVVISSGRTETFLKYKEVAYDLGRQGYSVYIHDHRGQGFSGRLLAQDPEKGHVERFDDYVDDLHSFVTNVVRSEPHKKLFLLAHSMGGGIATRYIERYPETFSAAALSSPMLAPDAKIFVSAESSCQWFKLSEWLCPTCYAGFTAKPYAGVAYDDKTNGYTHSAKRFATVLKMFNDNPKARLGGPTRRWAGEACRASDAMLVDVNSIRIPVLVLQAGADEAVTPQGQDQFCASLHKLTGRGCGGASGEPIRIPGARHELLIEADEFRVPALTAILGFFASQTSE